MLERNYYEVLGVSRSASADEIHAHYLDKLHQVHPDRNAGEEEDAHERTIEVVNAYRVLSDPKQRKLYDFKALNPFTLLGETPGLRMLLSKERKEAEACFNQAVGLLKADELAKAVEPLKAAIRLEPAFSAASYDLALLGALLGNANFSLDVLAKAMAADPKDTALPRLRKAILSTFLSV